ncbi:MAG: aminoacetone oxidase family FAD-binding enzyme [Chloroflexi bacterium]|nr:aminoacetone oxidase family FAD-binding enzyme [Chloroflexota bacterium]MDA1003885.1 aminoacetone oxidase family FAD-binding enzyme [Chloroflexota bacterium]
MSDRVDLVVVGAGAAGLMAAIWAGRSGARPIVLDGARVLGAKILVSGGSRCNVTHDVVDERAFAGSTTPAIRRVLRRFDVGRTVAFFADLGVELKREDTGKLFPVTDDAHTVLDALLKAARDAGAEIRHPWRVASVERREDMFLLNGPAGEIVARRLILATGGKSVPRSGSDGAGLAIARALGHSVTPRLVPALVGLTLAEGSFVRALSGLSTDATIDVRSGTGKRLHTMTGSTLCTHFGLSGPAPMDVSRHWQVARAEDPGVQLVVRWLPDATAESLDAALQALGGDTPLRLLSRDLPARLARALCDEAAVDAMTPGHVLTREHRRALVRAVLDTPLPVTGTRGWNHAEATAGGIPLAEVRLDSMESRLASDLFLCGEMLDVDGRIGGYNFQWAWSSGYVAGRGAAGDRAAVLTAEGHASDVVD